MASAVELIRTGRLPAEMTTFVGRRREVAEAKRLLEGARLVTLAGVSGVGKSRLALRVATDLRGGYSDGVWFVELSALHEADLLAQTVGAALGLADQAAGDPLDRLVDHVADKRMLLVLDTCEHLVDACAMLAEVLLRAAPGLRVLATSREPLDVPGEHLLGIVPLTVPDADGPQAPSDAMSLFADRAAAVQPGFVLDNANQPAVARLCRRLDGIPLAIELAAVRLRTLTVDQLVARLDDRFRLLGSSRTRLGRHQTLHAAVSWSHELCTEDERVLWARLSVFAGSFDLEATERVCGADALDTLSRLVEKSIVARAPGGRFRLLDTIRDYGAERLAQLGETESARDRHAAWYTELAARTAEATLTERHTEMLTRLREDHTNLRTALEHASGPGLAASLIDYWVAFGLFNEGRLWLGRAVATAGGSAEDRFATLRAAAALAGLQGDTDTAAELREQAAALPGDPADLIELDALAAVMSGETDRSVELLTEALTVRRKSGFPDLISLLCLTVLGGAHVLRGELEDGLARAEECLEICTELGEGWCRSYGLWVRAGVRWAAAEYETGLVDLYESLRIRRAFGDRLGITMSIDLAAGYAAGMGDLERAARLYGAADRLWRTLGAPMFGPGYVGTRQVGITVARATLGDEAYERAARAGAAMSDEEAVAYALGEGRTEPNELTPRELEIAGLVAEGLSNREIAERLVIAKRTADSHVEHILAKLSFTSRTQVAAWAATRADRKPEGGSP